MSTVSTWILAVRDIWVDIQRHLQGVQSGVDVGNPRDPIYSLMWTQTALDGLCGQASEYRPVLDVNSTGFMRSAQFRSGTRSVST
jgi:hypothetical protein